MASGEGLPPPEPGQSTENEAEDQAISQDSRQLADGPGEVAADRHRDGTEGAEQDAIEAQEGGGDGAPWLYATDKERQGGQQYRLDGGGEVEQPVRGHQQRCISCATTGKTVHHVRAIPALPRVELSPARGVLCSRDTRASGEIALWTILLGGW